MARTTRGPGWYVCPPNAVAPIHRTVHAVPQFLTCSIPFVARGSANIQARTNTPDADADPPPEIPASAVHTHGAAMELLNATAPRTTLAVPFIAFVATCAFSLCFPCRCVTFLLVAGTRVASQVAGRPDAPVARALVWAGDDFLSRKCTPCCTSPQLISLPASIAVAAHPLTHTSLRCVLCSQIRAPTQAAGSAQKIALAVHIVALSSTLLARKTSILATTTCATIVNCFCGGGGTGHRTMVRCIHVVSIRAELGRPCWNANFWTRPDTGKPDCNGFFFVCVGVLGVGEERAESRALGGEDVGECGCPSTFHCFIRFPSPWIGLHTIAI